VQCRGLEVFILPERFVV